MGSISTQRGGTGGASKALSNLANVAINVALVPDADSTRDLGSSSALWKNLFIDNVVGPTVFNEAGADRDFRFEGLTNPNLLSLDASLNAVGIGVVPIAGTKLALPLENDAATPTLAFGGGGDGLYSRTDTTLSIALMGVWSYNFSTTNLSAVVSGGFHASLRRVNPTATVPSVVPSVLTSGDTGIGLAAAGQLSLIAGAIEGIRVNTVGSGVNRLDVTPGATGTPVLLGVEGSDADIDLQLVPKGTGVVHLAKAVDGRFVGLLIENSQAAAGGSTNETAEIKFGFGGNNDVARISADKLDDYTTGAKEDARISFWVDIDGVLTEIVHVMNDGLMLIQPGSNIRFVGTAGGSGSIQYKDSLESNRAALMFKDDIVGLVNRTVDGVIEIRPNSAAGGNTGEVIVATFEDDEIRLLENGGNLGIGTAAPLVGLHATGLVEGTGDLKDIVGVFQGATGGTQNGYLFTSDDVASDVWLAFRGVPADTNQWLMGVRFFSGDTFAIGYGSKDADMTFPLGIGAKFVITTGGLVGIGTTTPATSALLELSSTTGALLVPRMTTTQRNLLTVSDGMIIYNVTTATMQGRINGAWTNM